MKIKLDENLPTALIEALANLGHDVHSVPDERLGGFPDETIMQAAQDESRFLITQDLDFSDIRRFAPGKHPGILLVRLHVPGRKMLLNRLSVLFETEDVSQWRGCFVVATDHKVRVRRPDPAM